MGQRYGQVVKSVSLTKGMQVRATISWDSCPSMNPDKAGTSPQPLGTDFDLFLCNDEKATCVVSMSADDNIEGFQQEVPETGTYDIWIMHDKDATGCGSDHPDFQEVFWILSFWWPS